MAKKSLSKNTGKGENSGKGKNSEKGKKSGRASGRKAASSQRDRLEQELIETAKQVDAEGLLFLLRQAQVIIHNAQVDKLNTEEAELDRSDDVSGSANKLTPSDPRPVSIEDAGNGKAFFLTINGVRKILDTGEMKRLVRICYTAESKSAALGQLYTVLRRERADILSDAGVSSPGSSVMNGLFYAVREKFNLKGST